MRATIAFAVAIIISASSAISGPVSSACLNSGRSVSQPLCACIQNVADMTLTGSDQKLAASLLRDPEKAEEIRVSDRERNKTFWARYQSFASTAGSVCSAG